MLNIESDSEKKTTHKFEQQQIVAKQMALLFGPKWESARAQSSTFLVHFN